MSAVAWLLLSAISASPCDGSAAPAPARPIYVLLIGHPDAPPGEDLARLEAVEDDVVRMHRFFSGLEPRAIHTHVAASDGLYAKRPEIQPREPTFSGVLDSVRRFVDAMGKESERPTIYVYYSGHGLRSRRGDFDRLSIFFRPEVHADGIGSDGIVDSVMFGEHVITPLEAVADVHLVVDACQSYFLLEPRGVEVRRRTKRVHRGTSKAMVKRFVSAHPRTGAILATNGSQATYEKPDLGGLFSYAVRSSALGPADLDLDGRITYGEMRATIPQVLAGQGGSGDPGVVGIGGDDDAVFVELATLPSQPLCWNASDSGRHELFDAANLPYAVVHPAATGTTAVYLPKDTRWSVMARSAPTERPDWFEFEMKGGPFASVTREPLSQRSRGRERKFVGEMLPAPLRRDVAAAVDAQPSVPKLLPGYFTLTAAATLRVHPVGGPGEVDVAPGGALGMVAGRGRHHAVGHVGYARGSGRFATNRSVFTIDVVESRIGYGVTLLDRRMELSLVGQVGADLFVQRSELTPTNVAVAFVGTAGVRAALPVTEGDPFAVFVTALGGAHYLCTDGCGEAVASAIVTTSVGIEWETPG
ncbi:MAG: caspase family protein [Deltaproteobacteria bacterium]